jgi:hypothetical protein
MGDNCAYYEARACRWEQSGDWGVLPTLQARDQHKLAELDSAYTAQLLGACAAARASAAGSEAANVAAREAYNAEYTTFKKQHRPASKIAPAVRNSRPVR